MAQPKIWLSRFLGEDRAGTGQVLTPRDAAGPSADSSDVNPRSPGGVQDVLHLGGKFSGGGSGRDRAIAIGTRCRDWWTGL